MLEIRNTILVRIKNTYASYFTSSQMALSVQSTITPEQTASSLINPLTFSTSATSNDPIAPIASRMTSSSRIFTSGNSANASNNVMPPAQLNLDLLAKLFQ